jgi:hypothetical protein
MKIAIHNILYMAILGPKYRFVRSICIRFCRIKSQNTSTHHHFSKDLEICDIIYFQRVRYDSHANLWDKEIFPSMFSFTQYND